MNKEKDISIETIRSGKKVWVRLYHIPTRLSAQCEGRTQYQCQRKAMDILERRLLNKMGVGFRDV